MGEAVERLELKLSKVYVPPHVRVENGKRIHVDGYWREGKRIKLYRGEGSHDAPSYYPKESGEAGAWWTTDLAAAQRYAKSARGGKVYEIEVEEGSEAEPRGLPGYYVISDPKIRERRVLKLAQSYVPPHERDGKPVKGYWREIPMSFKGVDETLATGLRQGIEQVARNFPEAAALVNRVYAVYGTSGVFGARYRPGEITIAGEHYTGGAKGARWTGSHEMGHAVLEAAGVVPSYEHAVGDTKVMKALLRAAGAKGRSELDLRKWLAEHVSRYAGSGIWQEAVAEALAASYEGEGDAKKFGLKVRKLLRERIDSLTVS